MKVYQGYAASSGLVLGQVSRVERRTESFGTGPFNPDREQRLLDRAVKTAQAELDSMAERSGPTEQAIFLFQSMMLEDEGFMNEVRFQIKAGVGAAEAVDRAGRRYADQLAQMEDNAYMQLRSVDILDAARRVVNILTNRPRVWLALDHPVILAAEVLMPSDLFSVPAGMILGIITAEGNKQSHAAIIARAMHIPGIVQVGSDFLNDCDGRTAILDADKEGFLRSETSLIQTIGRAARNADGMVVMYADTITPSMRRAIDETERRREKQDAFNKAHGIVPRTVIKSVRELLEISATAEDVASNQRQGRVKAMTRQEKSAEIARLEKAMKEAAKMLEFELAATLRDQIIELRGK